MINEKFLIKQIDFYGGSCPWQLEATTEEGFSVYARVRHGYLRVDICNDTVLSKPIEHDGADGCFDYTRLRYETRNIIVWPKDFHPENIYSYEREGLRL